MTKVIPYKKMLIKRLGSLKDAIVLDYGCGRGDFVELMLNQEHKPKCIYAIDSNKEAIKGIEDRYAAEIKTRRIIPKICTSPDDLRGISFDKIICQNVLECLNDKIGFINQFADILSKNGIFILSHHDFDSALYNSSNKALTRELIHHFADTKQEWMVHADGLMGRKIPGLMSASIFKNSVTIETWRIVEREFKPGLYGHLMVQMIQDVAKPLYEADKLETWVRDLEQKALSQDYYFAIDLVVATVKGIR